MWNTVRELRGCGDAVQRRITFIVASNKIKLFFKNKKKY